MPSHKLLVATVQTQRVVTFVTAGQTATGEGGMLSIVCLCERERNRRIPLDANSNVV